MTLLPEQTLRVALAHEPPAVSLQKNTVKCRHLWKTACFPVACFALIAEVLRRRVECELAVVPKSFQACVVQNRSVGPVRIGSVEFASVKSDGSPRAGAKVTLSTSKQVWRVLATHADGRLRLRSGTNVVIVRPERTPVVHSFRVFVYSIEGQAFRVTASDVAEPPLFQGKVCYWETRCLPEVPAFYRILLEGDGWGLMGKSHTQRLL